MCFAGSTRNIEELYKHTDVVLLASGDNEGIPNVVLEGYLRNLPVIVSDTEGGRKIVTDTNLVFSVGDCQGIAKCIKYIENKSDEEYYAMVKENRDRVMREYDVNKMARKMYAMLVKTAREG